MPSFLVSHIVILMLIGGALGGAAEFLRRFSFADRSIVLLPDGAPEQKAGQEIQRVAGDRISFIETLMLLLVAMVIGCAGAIGVQFVFVLLGAAKISTEAQDQLFLLSVSAAAGFGARRLLVSLSTRIEEHVRQLDLKTAAATEAAHAAERRARQAADSVVRESQFANSIESVMRGQTGPSTKAHVIRRLQEEIAKDPIHGGYAIPLSFILRNDRQVDEAIAVIDKYLRAKEEAKQVDTFYGAALYNKSCFLALRYGAEGAEPDRKSALAALRRSLELNERNWEYAVIDKDLAALRSDPEFREIMSSAPEWAKSLNPEGRGSSDDRGAGPERPT